MLSDQGLIHRIVDPKYQLLQNTSRGPCAAGKCVGRLLVVCFAFTSTAIFSSTPANAQDAPQRVVQKQHRSISDDLLESKQRIETPTPWLFPKDEITVKPLPPIPKLFPTNPKNAGGDSGLSKPDDKPIKLLPQAESGDRQSKQPGSKRRDSKPPGSKPPSSKQANHGNSPETAKFPAIVELNELKDLLSFDNEPTTAQHSVRQPDAQPPADRFEVITSAADKLLPLPKKELGHWTEKLPTTGVSDSASASALSQVGARVHFNDGPSFSFIDASQAEPALQGDPVLMLPGGTGLVEATPIETTFGETESVPAGDAAGVFAKSSRTEPSIEVASSEPATAELALLASQSEADRTHDSLSDSDVARTKPNNLRPNARQAIGSHDSHDATTDRDVQTSGSKAITWDYLLSKLPLNGGEVINKVPVWTFFAPIALFIVWVLWPAGEEEDDGVEEAKRNLADRAEREREKTLRTEEAMARAREARDAAKSESEPNVDQNVEATEEIEAAQQPVAESDDTAIPELDPLAPFYAVGNEQSSKSPAANLHKPAIPKKLDDLTKLQGIDVVIQQALYNVGYYEYKDLQMADPSDLQYISSSFDRDIPCDGNEWSRQAAFAERGDWTGLEEYLQIKGVNRNATDATELGTEGTPVNS